MIGINFSDYVISIKQLTGANLIYLALKRIDRNSNQAETINFEYYKY